MKSIKSSILLAAMASAAVVSLPAFAQNPHDQTISSCCAQDLTSANMLTMFSEELLPGGNLTSNYGLAFNPTAAFGTAMDNSAFMVAVMAGIPVTPGQNWLALEAQLRTDNVPGNTVWPIPSGPFGTVVPAMPGSLSILAYNDVAYTSLTGIQIPRPHNRAYLNGLSPAHMRPDGTRYQLRLTYWLYSYNPKTDKITKRPVTCNGLPARTIGIRKNVAQGLRAGSAAPRLEMTTEAAPVNQANTRMTIGQAVELSPAEVSALPAQMRPGGR